MRAFWRRHAATRILEMQNLLQMRQVILCIRAFNLNSEVEQSSSCSSSSFVLENPNV